MENTLNKSKIKLLKSIVDIVSVSESRYEDAEGRYQSISNWLSREKSNIKNYYPRIYIHGSFALGTAINPFGRDNEFDLDIMCCLESLDTSKITQYGLKKLIGDEITSFSKQYNMEPPEDKTRAWTLNYNDKASFHIDIMPAIPKNNNDTSVYIPFKESSTYNQITLQWERESNPKGYLDWFKSIMRDDLISKRKNLAESRKVTIEEIPEYKVKTMLQQVIILLKRHRDVFFSETTDDLIKDEGVSSIIITTLAGLAYKKEISVADCLFNIVDSFENNMYLVQNLRNNKFKLNESFVYSNEIFKIANPSNPNENFTDKWADNPHKKRAFFEWLKELKKDCDRLKKFLYSRDSDVEILTKMFGSTVFNSLVDFISKDIEDNEVNYIKKLDFPTVNYSGNNALVKGYVNNQTLKDTPDFQLFKYKFNSNDKISKGKHLLFIAETNVPEPFILYWQVANKENEAVRKNAIRGEITNVGKYGKNLIHRWQKTEETSYNGKHWIRCFVVKDNVCVACSSKFYVNIGE